MLIQYASHHCLLSCFVLVVLGIEQVNPLEPCVHYSSALETHNLFEFIDSYLDWNFASGCIHIYSDLYLIQIVFT